MTNFLSTLTGKGRVSVMCVPSCANTLYCCCMPCQVLQDNAKISAIATNCFLVTALTRTAQIFTQPLFSMSISAHRAFPCLVPFLEASASHQSHSTVPFLTLAQCCDATGHFLHMPLTFCTNFTPCYLCTLQ